MSMMLYMAKTDIIRPSKRSAGLKMPKEKKFQSCNGLECPTSTPWIIVIVSKSQIR
jgi:hypothetical protein